MKESDLFGQLSETGKPFNHGYCINSVNGSYHFAEGEETERDELLKEKGFFDEETSTWEMLCAYDEDSFYYSEWFVEDNMDGGYDEKGNFYLHEDGKFILENPFINLDDYEIREGDGVEYELWEHKETKQIINIPIEIVRDFKNITIV